VGTSSNSKCTGSVNSILAGSCNYLSTSATTWLADGNYQTTIGGISYVVNILSYTDPQTSTLAWKLIVVGEGSMPTSNYMSTIMEATAYSITDIKNRFTTLETLPQFLNFFSGSSLVAPLTNNIVQRTNPSINSYNKLSVKLRLVPYCCYHSDSSFVKRLLTSMSFTTGFSHYLLLLLLLLIPCL
jgi:hypothetical protein